MHSFPIFILGSVGGGGYASEPFKNMKIRKKISKWSFFVADQLVYVEGLTDDDELFRTSPIIYAPNTCKVVTVSGNAYALGGNLYFKAFLTSGYPVKLLQSFKYGFPSNWRYLIKKYLRTEVHLDVTNEANDVTLRYPRTHRKSDNAGGTAGDEKRDRTALLVDNYPVSSPPLDKNMSGIGQLQDDPNQSEEGGKVLLNITNRSSKPSSTKVKSNTSLKTSKSKKARVKRSKASKSNGFTASNQNVAEASGENTQDHIHLIKDCRVTISPMTLRSRPRSCRYDENSQPSEEEPTQPTAESKSVKKTATRKTQKKSKAPKPRKKSQTSTKPRAKSKGKTAAKQSTMPKVKQTDKENNPAAGVGQSASHSSRVELSGVDQSMMTPTRVLNTSNYSIHQRMIKQRAQSLKRKQIALGKQ